MTAFRVLHIDDDSDIREVVVVSLALDPDIDMRSCGSGREALALIADWPPDLILLDAAMPEMDGPTTLARLRENTATADIPVVFMTARAQTREIELFRTLGAVGVMPKPFDPMTLAAVVRTYILPSNGRLDTMRELFLQRANSDAVTLAKHRTALRNGTTAPATLTGIRDIAHALAGAGGIFGYSDISDAAAALEDAIIAERDGSESVEGIASALDRLLIQVEANSFASAEGSYSGAEGSHVRFESQEPEAAKAQS